VSLADGIYTYLTTTATDVVAISGDRVYPGFLPQNAKLPAITVERISGGRDIVMGGISGLEHPRMQITSWASTYEAAKALAEEVRLVTDAHSGAMGAETIRAVIIQDESDAIVMSPQLEGRRIYGVRQDYDIWHVEATS